jgi:hypothetical protein
MSLTNHKTNPKLAYAAANASAKSVSYGIAKSPWARCWSSLASKASAPF